MEIKKGYLCKETSKIRKKDTKCLKESLKNINAKAHIFFDSLTCLYPYIASICQNVTCLSRLSLKSSSASLLSTTWFTFEANDAPGSKSGETISYSLQCFYGFYHTQFSKLNRLIKKQHRVFWLQSMEGEGVRGKIKGIKLSFKCQSRWQYQISLLATGQFFKFLNQINLLLFDKFASNEKTLSWNTMTIYVVLW